MTFHGLWLYVCILFYNQTDIKFVTVRGIIEEQCLKMAGSILSVAFLLYGTIVCCSSAGITEKMEEEEVLIACAFHNGK